MGFFATFWDWLRGTLTGYIGENTARMAAALEPFILALATVSVMCWGYLLMTGRVEEPISAGLKRLVVLASVLGVSLHLWLYNTLIVDTFYSAPARLAAAIVGVNDPVATIDAIWRQGGLVAQQIWSHGMLPTTVSVAFMLVAALVYLLIGLLCVYAMFLIALASIATAVLLALGPFFVALLLFDGTRRFFDAWTAQLANYGLISILTTLVGTLMLHVVESYAAQTAARGPSLQLVDAFDMLLVASLVLLLLRQIMPIAASLASGLALSSFGTLSRGLAASFGSSRVLAGRAVALALSGEARAKLRPVTGRSTGDIPGRGPEEM